MPDVSSDGMVAFIAREVSLEVVPPKRRRRQERTGLAEHAPVHEHKLSIAPAVPCSEHRLRPHERSPATSLRRGEEGPRHHDVVLQVLPHPREVVKTTMGAVVVPLPYIELQPSQRGLVPDPGSHQQGRRVDGARAQDDLSCGAEDEPFPRSLIPADDPADPLCSAGAVPQQSFRDGVRERRHRELVLVTGQQGSQSHQRVEVVHPPSLPARRQRDVLKGKFPTVVPSAAPHDVQEFWTRLPLDQPAIFTHRLPQPPTRLLHQCAIPEPPRPPSKVVLEVRIAHQAGVDVAPPAGPRADRDVKHPIVQVALRRRGEVTGGIGIVALSASAVLGQSRAYVGATVAGPDSTTQEAVGRRRRTRGRRSSWPPLPSSWSRSRPWRRPHAAGPAPTTT
mmetsp:Transcript_23358/g.49987  ORF Transcript_23358/g.49987 Transcript_23358/m.49987 type:complete len:393 (-) Transcript_23358:235-1413(-)